MSTKRIRLRTLVFYEQYINISLHFRYLFTDIIFSKKETVFWEWSLRKTVSFEKEIMAEAKYPSIFFFWVKWRLLRLLSLKCFSLYMGSDIWVISLRYSPVQEGYIQSCGVFRAITYECKYWMDYNPSYI